MFPRNDISDKLQIITSQFSESESTRDMDEIDNKSNDTLEDVLKEVTNSYFYPGCFLEDNTEGSPNMTFNELDTELQNRVLPVSREYGVVRFSPLLKVRNDRQPPKGFMKDFTGRPYAKVSSQNYGASDSDPPAGTTEIEHEICKQETSTNANISGDAEMNITAELQNDDHASKSAVSFILFFFFFAKSFILLLVFLYSIVSHCVTLFVGEISYNK